MSLGCGFMFVCPLVRRRRPSSLPTRAAFGSLSCVACHSCLPGFFLFICRSSRSTFSFEVSFFFGVFFVLAFINFFIPTPPLFLADVRMISFPRSPSLVCIGMASVVVLPMAVRLLPLALLLLLMILLSPLVPVLLPVLVLLPLLLLRAGREGQKKRCSDGQQRTTRRLSKGGRFFWGTGLAKATHAINYFVRLDGHCGSFTGARQLVGHRA
jgi:hypothetical protein